MRNYFLLQNGKGLRGHARETVSIITISPMHLGFALFGEKIIVQYRCYEQPELDPFLLSYEKAVIIVVKTYKNRGLDGITHSSCKK